MYPYLFHVSVADIIAKRKKIHSKLRNGKNNLVITVKFLLQNTPEKHDLFTLITPIRFMTVVIEN